MGFSGFEITGGKFMLLNGGISLCIYPTKYSLTIPAGQPFYAQTLPYTDYLSKKDAITGIPCYWEGTNTAIEYFIANDSWYIKVFYDDIDDDIHYYYQWQLKPGPGCPPCSINDFGLMYTTEYELPPGGTYGPDPGPLLGLSLVATCDTGMSDEYAYVKHASRDAKPIQSHDLAIIDNLATCSECEERPEGCWKKREYQSTLDYTAAGVKAAENHDCPIGKLK